MERNSGDMQMNEPIRRIVTGSDEYENPIVLFDGPTPDVRTDPSRPGYISQQIWATDRTPAQIRAVKETLPIPRIMEPSAGGSIFRIVTFPPDAPFIRSIGAGEIQSFFHSIGSPHASTYSDCAPHPCMQKTDTLDFCIVLEGEITLVLETEEVLLRKGDIVVQRGTNHAWSNRSDKPCMIAFSHHDGKFIE
jgi:mannose-6-phosphate isomerase-like protein (cupin superfamily)